MLIKWSFQHSEFHSNLFLFGVDVDWSSWIIHKLLSKVIYKRHEYTLDEGNFFSQRNCHHFIAWKVVEWNNNLNGILTIKLNWKLWARFFRLQGPYITSWCAFLPTSVGCVTFYTPMIVLFLLTRARFWGALETKENSISRDTRPFLRCIRNKRKFDKSCHRSHRSGATVSFHPFPII